MIVIPVRDFYQNIPEEGKVRELTKDKLYECKVEYNWGKKYFSLINDLGDKKTYCKKNMFITKSKVRDNKIEKILK